MPSLPQCVRWRKVSEEWRSVPGFDNYRVSDAGRVVTAKGRSMRLHATRGGYLCVSLYREGRYSHRLAHRLVLEAFVGPCPEGFETRHLNGVRTDNRLANLAWGTSGENATDRERHGTTARGVRCGAHMMPERRAVGSRNGKHTMPERTARGERVNTAKLTAEQALEIRAASGKVRDIAARYGISKSMVSYIRRGESWRHL